MAWGHREFYSWYRGAVIGSEGTMRVQVNTVALNLHSFKGLRQELARDDGFIQLGFGSLQPPRYTKQINERLAHLATVNPNPEFDPQFCGE